MNEMTVFNFEENEVRTGMISGEPCWVAKDVAKVLGYKDTVNAIKAHCKGVAKHHPLQTPGGKQELRVIGESDLYRLIANSNLPSAEKFERWIFEEVLPTIRKTGGAYLTAQKAEELLLNPDLIIDLANQIKTLRAETAQQQLQIEADRPKTIFADAVSASHTTILVGELAKLLKQNNIEIGQNRLFEWLRTNGFLIKRKGTDWNMPTQRAMEMGLFEVKERTINEPNGSIRITKTTKVTGKGQLYFVNLFLKEMETAEA